MNKKKIICGKSLQYKRNKTLLDMLLYWKIINVIVVTVTTLSHPDWFHVDIISYDTTLLWDIESIVYLFTYLLLFKKEKWQFLEAAGLE